MVGHVIVYLIIRVIEAEGYRVPYLWFLICPVAIWSMSPYSFFTVVILVLFRFVLFLAQLVLQSVFFAEIDTW